MKQEKENNESKTEEEEIPLCLNCLQPVNPLQHICPHCGRAVGQLTPLMPYESLRWQIDIWGKMWRQVWSNETSFAGKLLRLLMIAWRVPVMLIGVIPQLWQNNEVPNDKQQ